MKSVLITRGAGFIGSNLCEHFLRLGYRVRCLDNFSTGHSRNIDGLMSHKNFELEERNIRDYNVSERSVDNMEYVLHKAA